MDLPEPHRSLPDETLHPEGVASAQALPDARFERHAERRPKISVLVAQMVVVGAFVLF